MDCYLIEECPTCKQDRSRVNPEWLKDVRGKAKMTQQDVADVAKIARPTIASIEAGTRACPDYVRDVYIAIWARTKKRIRNAK